MRRLYVFIGGLFIFLSVMITQPAHAANKQQNQKVENQPVLASIQHSTTLSMPATRIGLSNSKYVPQVSISTHSYPIGIKGKETKLIPYRLNEAGNVSGEITERTYQFFTQYDTPLSDVIGPFPASISVRSLNTTNWDELVYLPQSVVDKARSLDEYALVLKTTFKGISHSGETFNVQSSLLLLLPPASFSKNTPLNGAGSQLTNLSLQWSSSIGAIDYEYCFDLFDNNSCDTEWTGTYWLGTYDTNAALQNLPSGTTFYWQVRANNMAGTTYANDGAWWSFTTACNTSLITVTNTNDFGAGSLRQAIADICPGGSINFDSSLAGQTISLKSTLLIYKDLSINGSALASKIHISGNNSVTVFDIPIGLTVILKGLVITNGNSGNGSGGGIQTAGTLNIENSVISHNSGGFGGGIQNIGTLNFTNSVVSDNIATEGAGIYNSGILNITNSTLSQNLAERGGGIITTGAVNITNSTFSANSSSHEGGGILNYGALSIKHTTFSNNSADTYGGGIYIGNGTLNLTNTILANSLSGSDCYNENNKGTIGANISNLIEINAAAPNACGDPAFIADPKLGSLANNHGWTQTFALLAGSPVINAGDDANCSATDQRGVTRPQGIHCDIGAYEAVITFADVEPAYWAWNFIEGLYAAGITGGCQVSPPMYCPDGIVTRAQMAVFLERGIHGSSYNPPAVGGSTGFGDVQPAYWAGAWIKQLAVDGITGGCGSGNYCPEAPVTRAQMAVFLLRSKHGASYSPPAMGSSTGFGDVPLGYWSAAWIKQLVAEGITVGCGAGNYCPEAPVTRAQMAVFLVRTFSLP